MRILILGSGGREHAITWKLNQSSAVDQLYCAPGNAGIAEIARCFPLNLNDFEQVKDFIEAEKIDFTVVGPEQPLVAGLVDFLTAHGHAVFGPNQKAARLEGSKIFAKNFMKKYNIPTAAYETFTDPQKALQYLEQYPEERVVVKADGLAAGKGSVVCENREQAREAIRQMMVEGQFAEAGKRVVIEEFMQGHEASLFVITDGKDYQVLSPAQDYKRALDGDRGKNTGGMGSYAPTPVLTTTMRERALLEIVEPTLLGLRSEGIEYKGVLYCGLMVTNKGPKVVEFNCRFGDPETQVVLPLLDSDLLQLLLAVHEGTVGSVDVRLKEEFAVCVIAASGGYPDRYETGKEISGLDRLDEEVICFHAGTRREDGKIVTNGGRVLGVTALDKDLKKAVDKVYRNIAKIHFEGMFFRKDIAEIGWKLLS